MVSNVVVLPGLDAALRKLLRIQFEHDGRVDHAEEALGAASMDTRLDALRVDLVSVVLDLLGVPDETTTGEGFCRDWLADYEAAVRTGTEEELQAYLDWVRAEMDDYRAGRAAGPYVPAPPEDCWIAVAGHRWITNGHVVIREGRKLPSSRQPWYRSPRTSGTIVEESLANLRGARKLTYQGLHPNRSESMFADEHGNRTWVALEYELLFDGVEVWQGDDPLDPIEGREGGETVVVVMPLNHIDSDDAGAVRHLSVIADAPPSPDASSPLEPKSTDRDPKKRKKRQVQKRSRKKNRRK